MLHVNGMARRSARSQLVRGVLAALALAVVCLMGARASAEDAPAGADSIEAAGFETLGACENSCRQNWQFLVDECKQLPGPQRGPCLRMAREDYDACLANCP